MKKISSIILVFLLGGILFSQSLIQNPPLPQRKNSNSDIQVKEIMRISDEGGEFFFKSPNLIRVDDQGNIYTLDSWAKTLYKFSSKGKFLGNLVKVGQGPGEINYLSKFELKGNNIILTNNSPAKVIEMDTEGKLIREFRFQLKDRFNLICKKNSLLYGFVSGFPVPKANSQYLDVPSELVSLDMDGKLKHKISIFPVKKYMVREGGAMGMFSIGMLHYAVGSEDKIFVSHTPEYLIKCLDMSQKKVLFSFNRQYKRQKAPPVDKSKPTMILNNKNFYRPQQKYQNDIITLLIYKNTVWVITSTVVEGKGVLVDIFNFKGKYIDNVYLKLSNKINLDRLMIWIYNSHLYTIEKDEEGNPIILKYKLTANLSK
jgi:hypothetical protein